METPGSMITNSGIFPLYETFSICDFKFDGQVKKKKGKTESLCRVRVSTLCFKNKHLKNLALN
jgi:hypothetical protein